MMAFFFFNDTATTEIYTLSLHDALPISRRCGRRRGADHGPPAHAPGECRAASHREQVIEQVLQLLVIRDRKSTRLNSSHANISYAVFCLKKKKNVSSQI